MATSDEWSRVGFTGNPVTGNPGVVENITKELRGLSDLAGRVDSGLDALLTKAEDGGFEGRTADALRTYVKDELKTFMANVNRSFDMAANATARYARALGDSQDRAENAADTVAALERVGGRPLPENDPELTRARGEVDAETDAVQAEAKILEEALREAARLVSRPVKKPKKSFWKRFVSTFFKVLEIVALVITLVAAVIGGPLGLVAFGLGAVLFAKALVDYATGNGNALSLGLAFLGILFPSTKGLTTLGGLARMASAGTKALGGALSASGRLLFRGGRMLFSSPGRLLSLAGQGLVRFGGGLGSRAAGGFMALPRVLSRTPAMLGSALRFMGGFARSTFRQGWSTLSRDFVESTAFVGGNTAGRLGVFTVLSLGRLTMTALLPMRYSEIARFGYRGAFRMGFVDRGLHFAPRTVGTLGRTGSLAGDLTDLTGRNLDRGGSLRPVTGTDTDRLAVPGTPEFNDTLDELAEISVTPVTTPRIPGFSSLTGSGTPRMPGRLDDMGGRLTTLDTLDTVGLPVGTFPGGQRLGVLNPVTGRVGDDLMPPRLRTTLTLFDQVDEFGVPLTPGSPTTLLPPRNTVDELRDLDELTGMERTGAGLLKPLDELSDLAELSLDGRLGGLTEFQVSKILDGEIDLVNVAPDGVVLRIGKTDPVDVRVRLKDGVKVDVLGPSDPRVPTWNTTTGADRLDELGIKLDDLTRLIPDTTDGSRAARDLLGLGPARTDLTTPVAKSPAFTPLTLRDIVTGGATGKLATERFQAWVRTQATQLQLDTAGRRLGELDELTDLPPLSRARAELDLSAARLDLDRSRIAFDRLGMNLDIVNRDITVMMTRVDGPAGALPTGELRLLDDLGRPTGQWITMEPGPTVTWVLRSDAGIVPDVKVRMADGVFTVTTPEGVVTRFGADGRPTVLGDPGSVTLPRLPGTGMDEVVLPAPRRPDRLAFAADRTIDIQTITPAPVWRATDETLWRIGGKRPLDQIFSEGFTVRDPLETSLDVMVRTGQPSAFVSTTTDRNLIWDGIFKFEIEASGGIDVGRTFERSMGTDAWRTSGWATESEIAFPGGIASEFIRGAYRMDGRHNLLEWIPNPNFRGDNPLPELAVGLKGAGEGTSGISALDFQGLSLDDQLRMLDQLDLGEARAFDDIGSPNGSNALDEVGSQSDDLGYLSDEFHFDRFDAPAPRAEAVLVDPREFAGVTGFRTEWQRTPLDEGGSMFTGQAGDIRLVFDAGEVLRFSDVRIPIGDGFVRFDADAGPGSLPRIVGQDGVPLPGGATIEPVRGALGVVTGVRVQSPDGAWIGRFDLDGTRLSEQLTLSGPVGGPLTGSRLITKFTQLPGGAQSATFRLTVPGLGDGAFDVVRLDGDLAQRLPGGFSVTDTATGGRFVLDRGGRFVDLPAEGATPIRLDVSGSTVPDTSAGPLTTLDDLARLGDLGELGTVNRLALPDLPRTNLMPEPSGLDARFGATVTDGTPTPVNPARFDGMPLSGADELTDLRLRVTEFPATDLAPASFRIDVMDFGAPGGPVRLDNVTVTFREGGGLSITGPQGGVRWQFDGLGQLEYRDLPLTGTDSALRFTDDAVDPMPRVVGPDGVPVQGATLTPVRDTAGALSELTVRVPVPDTDGLTAVWRFEPGGTLRQQELPLTLPGIDGPAGLGVKVTITPGPGGTMTRVLELTGPSNLTGSFRLGAMDGSLAGRLPNGFTVTDTVTGARFHFDADGRLAIRDIPARDGSGVLRFTEDAAPGTPPVRLDELGDLGDFAGDLGDVARIFDRTLDEAGGVRGPLDDLNRLTGPDAPRTHALPALDDFAPGERELFDDLWNSVVQDVRTLTPEELNRVWGPDSPRTDTLSDLSDLSDTELADLQARLDNIRRMDDGPLGADEPLRVPLSGVDELADLDLRVTRLPATDEAPQGSYRLDLTDRTPGGTGPVRASDFTVELLDDSGRFAVIDPTGTTRFTLGPDGRFLGRETLLTIDGLPEGIRLNATVVPGADGTGRIVIDLLVPSGAAGSVRFTPTTGPLAARLPSGVTITDTVTGSRFHFDHTGRLAFRDLPDPDGSGFLRFTEGAGPDTPPVRLDELGDLGDFGGDLGERFPLDSIPENDVLDDALDTIDLAHVFDRTLDEASGIRTVPDGAQVDLSGVAGAMDFLRVAPDSHAVQALDLTGLQRLADDATASLDRFGLRPELLNDQLRQMTGQARQTLRQHAVTILGDYLDLPLATRLDDLQSVAQGAGGRVFGDFTVTPTPHGGPGGSRYTVHHNPSDITLGFGPNRELRYQEVFLRGGPEDLDGLKTGVTGRSADGGPWTPDSLDFVGTRTADGFTLTPGTEPRGGLTLTDAAGTTSWHYGPEGVHTLTDVKLPGDRGVLRFDADAPGGVPRVLDSAGHQLPGTRVELLDDGRIALVPTGKGAHPLERTVFDPAGTLLEETIAVRGKGGTLTGDFWKIDHVSGTAVRTDAAGTPFTGRFATAPVERSGTGQFRLTGADPGKVALFERETLKNGNVLHLSRDRFGQARWTEFDAAGNISRHGRRIGDADMRTFHDVPSGSWRRLLDNAGDVRTYTKGSDGGLVRAEKGPGGEWSWQRFGKDGTESLSGTRQWTWDHVGFKDTFLDPATGLETVAQRRGMTWPFGGEHGSRMYQEFSVVPGHAPAGGRIDAGGYTGHGLANAQIQSLETLADGGSLLVKRFAEMRPPAFLWKSAAGRSPFDGFFRDLFAGDSLHRVSHWTQTAADGTRLTGVRLNPTGPNWIDIDQYGRVVRETRKLDNGNTIEIGRSLDDPTRWAPAPEYRKGGSYELSWRDTTSGTSGTRHVDGNGRWRDLFTDENGVERVRLRSEGRNTREYLFEAPSTRDLAADDRAGTWVDKNSLLHVTGRRDLIDGRIVESSGSPYRTSWTWRAFSSDDPATAVAEGVRKQNRGSFYTKTWDDSFIDLDRLGNPVRERNATDTGSSWVDALKQPDGTWKWTKTAADGTVHSEGTRVYDDIAGGGRWRDLVDGQVVRQRESGGRVREFDYKILTPERPATLPTTGSLRDLLAHSARQFEPPSTVQVNTQVWKEYDLGKVFRERVAADGTPGRFREVDKQWGQWREFQDGHLVEQRTFTGRVWKTDAFGRLSTSGPAFIPEYLAGALPRIGDEVGLAGDTGWRLIGRETDFRGAEIEALGLLRQVQDPWHGVLTGVKDGISAEMPVWQRELRGALTSFTTGFVTEFTASLAITAATTGNGDITPLDVYKALLNGAVGGTFSSGLNVLYNRTALGYFKTSMGARDWGGHPKQSMAGNTDDWATDWAAQEKPTRWRNATYANTVGIATSALSGFVSNAISASVFGVNGHEVKGADALLAGLWGAGASAFSGVTTGLARNAFHLTTGARVFHKGGIPELGVTWGEAALTKYINWLIAEQDKKNGGNLPSPGRSFPTAPTTTTSTTPTVPSTTAPQPPAAVTADSPASPIEGSEFL
ncbi:scabin-related ADP-ribosyltransferase [Streptomyces sp. NPDC000878]